MKLMLNAGGMGSKKDVKLFLAVGIGVMAFFAADFRPLAAQDNTSQDNSSLGSTPDTSINSGTLLASNADVFKRMSLEELMNQDVTSVSKEPEPLGQAPAAITVITGDQIRRSGASSLPEALRLADNLQVAQKNAHDWAITARGFNTSLANKLLVLIDGRTVYSPLDAGVFWDQQNVMLEDIDRIEVISGPGGTLWGANAVNGVINVITKSAKDTQGFFVEGGGGSELQDFGNFRYGGKLAPDVYYRVYGMYFDRGSEVFANNGQSASDAWNLGQGGFRIDADPATDDKLTFQGDYYTGNVNEPMLGGSDIGGANVLGRWTHTLDTDSNLSLQLYYDRSHFTQPVNAILFEPAGTLKDTLDTYDLSFQHSFQAGERNHFIWGVGYRFTHDDVQNAPGLAFYPAVLNQNLYSCFIQDEIMILDNLHFTIGSKAEHNDYTGFEFEPSARLAWNVTPKQMIWGAVSRAVRAPSRIDRDFQQPTGFPAPFPSSLLSGSGGFQSETVIAYEIGYRAEITPKVSGSISTFYNDYDNLRSAAPSPAPALFGLPFVFQNNLQGQTYGFESAVTYQALDWWQLHASYNLLKEHLRVKPGEVDINDAMNETADPQQQFAIRSSMSLPQNVEFDTGLRWVDRLRVNNGPVYTVVQAYFELEARLAWHPTENMEISLVGQNLLHDHHVEYGYANAAQEAIERSVYGKITWRF